MLHINRLDIKKLVVGERSVLPHDTEVGTWTAILGHHFIGGVYIEQCHGKFLAFLGCGILFKHSHFEGLQDLTACASEANQNVVATAMVFN